MIQKCREVIDKYSKNFIDLGTDNNPHYDNEETANKERNYLALLKNTNILDTSNSKFFKIPAGENISFECLGLEEPRISQYENYMQMKLNQMSKHIRAELPEIYVVDDLIIKLNVNRR